MAEDKKPSSYWLPVLIAAIPITFGLFQNYNTQQQEFRKRFWEEQIALYKDAVDAASEIAMSNTLEEAAGARQKFWKLYWGKLSMIEHKEVEQAMKCFGENLGRCEAATTPSCFGDRDGSSMSQLRLHSYYLAHCIRYSLTETWNPAKIENSSDTCPYTERAIAEGKSCSNPSFQPTASGGR